MAKKSNNVWIFEFTPEQAETLQTVLWFAASELEKGSASPNFEGLAKKIASERVKEIANYILNITG